MAIFGLALANIFTIYINYNWFKGAVNEQCPHGNFGTLYAIMNPFMKLYTSLFNYALAILVICVAMFVTDVIHFIYIWRNELTHYLVDTGDKQMVKKETDDYQYLEQKDVFEVKDIKEFEERSLPKD